MKEEIVIVNEHDETIGYKKRGTLDAADIYRVSALWITNSVGDILLAQRSFNKKNNPGKWGPATAGTNDKDESYLENIKKEAEEEIGLTDTQFLLGPKIRKEESEGHNYFVQWYTAVIDKKIENFIIQKEELNDLKWFHKDTLIAQIDKEPDIFLNGLKENIKLFNSI